MKLKDFSPAIQAAFREEDQKVRIRNSIVGCWLAIILMPAGISLDYFVYPAQLWFFLKLRLFCALIDAGILLLFYIPFGKRHYRILSQVWYLFPALFISWMIFSTQGADSTYYAGLNIVLIAVGFMLPWTYQEILIGGLLVMGMYLAACFFHGAVTLQGNFYNNLYFLLLTDIIVVTGSYFSEQIRLSEFSLRFKLDQNSRSLEDAYRKLVELDQVKTRFFSNISHELRTPLTLLIGPLDSLHAKLGQFDGETRGNFQLMEANAMRLLRLINDLLDLVKMEKGELKARKETLRVDVLLSGIVNNLGHAAKEKKLNLTTDIQSDLPFLLLDWEKVEAIVLNLLFNSIKFTPAGGRVELVCRQENPYLLIQVKDSGIGISEEDLPHIFDRFFQVDASATRKHQGTGLGLSIVREYSELLGGHVKAESKLNEGTAISVYLPFEVAGSPAAAENRALDLQGAGEFKGSLARRAQYYPAMNVASPNEVHLEGPSRDFKSKVLVVDDEPDMRKFFKSMLEGKNLEVLEASDGLQGLEMARQFSPDLIVLDMMMPGKDGIKVCGELRENLLTRTIPIIMLTARADDETKLAALGAGANDFLTKPFSSTELNVRVENLLLSHQFQNELSRRKIELEALNDRLHETLDELLKTQAQLVQGKKMAGLGTMAAGLMHEILNPLNYAKNGFHALMDKKELSDTLAKYKDITGDIVDGLDRIQRIVMDLRNYTHPQSSTKKNEKLFDTVEMARRFLSNDIKDGVDVKNEVPPALELPLNKIPMSQVFLNLIKNSLDAFGNKDFGVVRPCVKVAAEIKDEGVWITVWDNGPGIPPELTEKIFEPFFTTKDVNKGMGLGLYIVHQTITGQGGSISVKSELGKFTEFNIRLPLMATE